MVAGASSCRRRSCPSARASSQHALAAAFSAALAAPLSASWRAMSFATMTFVAAFAAEASSSSRFSRSTHGCSRAPSGGPPRGPTTRTPALWRALQSTLAPPLPGPDDDRPCPRRRRGRRRPRAAPQDALGFLRLPELCPHLGEPGIGRLDFSDSVGRRLAVELREERPLVLQGDDHALHRLPHASR